MADNDHVLMTHPDHRPGTPPTTTTEFAFRELWEAKGWQRVEGKEPAPPPTRASRSKRRPA